jgi:hypothetical protein
MDKDRAEEVNVFEWTTRESDREEKSGLSEEEEEEEEKREEKREDQGRKGRRRRQLSVCGGDQAV